MDFPRWILPLLAAIACGFLTACIDGREELWVESDGSGRAEITYTLPATAARFQGGEEGVRRMIGEFLTEATGISSARHEVTTENGRLKVRVRCNFDSVLDLRKIAAGEAIRSLPSSATHMAGRVELQTSGRTVDFTRTISPGSALPGAALMPASMFDGRKLVYVIHLPVAPRSSNATRTTNGGRSLVWDFPLAEAVKSPISTRFVAQIPIPRWLVAVAVGLGVGLIFLSIRWARRLGKMRSSAAAKGAD